jgi:hypothetical protein
MHIEIIFALVTSAAIRSMQMNNFHVGGFSKKRGIYAGMHGSSIWGLLIEVRCLLSSSIIPSNPIHPAAELTAERARNIR